MRQMLKLHPDSRCAAATRIEAEVARPHSRKLALRYFVTGKMSELRWPPLTAPARTDELWRRTCFEAFVQASPGAAYYEFNFAPSTQWAAYRFSSYRSEMSAPTKINAPRIDVLSRADCCELQVALELDRLADLPGDAAWRVGLSAVIEDASGVKSYWALAHPPGEPDFHHSDCFAHQLAAAYP